MTKKSKKTKPNKTHKKKVLKISVAIHITTYLLIGVILSLLNVPAYIVFSVIMILLWGLIVMSHTYYYERE